MESYFRLFSNSFPSLTASSAVSLSWTPSGTLTVFWPFLVSPVCMSMRSLMYLLLHRTKPIFIIPEVLAESGPDKAVQELGEVVGQEEHPAEEVPGAEEGPGEV